MMKKYLSVLLISAFLATATGCFGEFALTRDLRNWNEQVSQSKFVNNLVFYALAGVLPVYEVAGLADLFIFNFIEYWTGNNPMAFQGKPLERKNFCYQGTAYEMQVDGKQLSLRNAAGLCFHLEFLADQDKWALQKPLHPTVYLSHQSVQGTDYMQVEQATKSFLLPLPPTAQGPATE